MSETNTFYTKQIQSPFTGNEDKIPIILQNKNGPCFLISLINTVLLSSSLPTTTSSSDSIVTHFKSTLLGKPTVSLSDVLNFLADSLIEANTNSISKDISIDELLKLLPSLNSGLNINPYLNNTVVSKFYENTQLINQLLNYFNTRIYHGFIMSPNLVSQLDGLQTFDKCQDFIIDCMDNEPVDDELKRTKFKNLKAFLDENKTELTQIGINELLNNLENNEVNIFFRNNHFSTIYKFNDRLYLLINDLGYKNQPEIIWQLLSISDDLDYLNSKFQVPAINEADENEKIDNKNSMRDENNPVENNYDLELAKQLQLEEDEQISKNLQKKYDDNSKSEANTNSRPEFSSKTASQPKSNHRVNSTPKFKNKPKTQTQSQPKGTSNKQKKSTKNSNNPKDSKDCVIM